MAAAAIPRPTSSASTWARARTSRSAKRASARSCRTTSTSPTSLRSTGSRSASADRSASDRAYTRDVIPLPLEEIRKARERIAGVAIRTPLVRLPDTDIWLKLENLQPIGSFKIRGAGNMAQGVAWNARVLGVPCTVVVPEHAPQTKLAAIERLGGRIVKVPFERWWQCLVDHAFPGIDGLFVHPVEDEQVMAGNGTIGLEILEDLPDVDTVLVPWGGGGLASGIASALRALKPAVRVY